MAGFFVRGEIIYIFESTGSGIPLELKQFKHHAYNKHFAIERILDS
jgi:hypothetical protein